MKTRITELLGIKYPVFQGAMAWIARVSCRCGESKQGDLALLQAVRHRQR